MEEPEKTQKCMELVRKLKSKTDKLQWQKQSDGYNTYFKGLIQVQIELKKITILKDTVIILEYVPTGPIGNMNPALELAALFSDVSKCVRIKTDEQLDFILKEIDQIN